MNKQTKKGLVPALRFPEFQGAADWEEVNLGSIGKVSMCKRILKNETKPNGDIPFYKIGTFGKQADAYIEREIFERYKNKYSYPKKGDILISASGTIGRLVVFLGEDAYFQDSNIVWIDNDESLVKNVFLYYCYKNIKWVTDDNTIARLYNENLRGMKTLITSVPGEQKKIANCLSSIDELVTAQNQMLEALKAHKKGLIQQLFPAEGDTVPKLRFPEFRGEGGWSEGCVGDLATLIMGNAFKSSDFVEDGIQLIRMGNLYSGILQLGRSPVFLPGSFEKENFKFVIKPLDLLMSMTGTVGKQDYGFVVQVPADSPSLMLNQRVVKVTPKNRFVKEFILQLLKSGSFLKNLYSLAGGTKQANLSGAQLKAMEIVFPGQGEQQKIADCLSSIDELISAKKNTVETLKNQKKGLIQQLLPTIEGVGK